MKTLDEIYLEYINDPLARMFRESKFGYGYNVPEDQKISYQEALLEAKKFREQDYTKIHRLYYHVSPLKLKFIKSMGNSQKPKLAFFALDPKFCIEFLKYKGSRYNKFYLHRCHLKSSVNLFNYFSKSDRQKIQYIKFFKGIINAIDNKKVSKALWWRIWEDAEVVKKKKKLGYNGIALDYSDDKFRINADNKYGIALFQGNKMKILDYAECDKNYLEHFNISSLEWKSDFD